MYLARQDIERDVCERGDAVVVFGDAKHRQRRLPGGAALVGQDVDGGFVDHDE
jgi:hypothetical protein